ncbi:hypothetical protein PFJ02_24245, partial [Mycobacterium xenopi]|uniref:hypothetical protein n=1 Tax=Mycobacterium xenopi TaxID=1789 RepID=UPI0022EB6FEC
MTVNVLLLPDKFSVPSLHEIVCDLPLPPRLSTPPRATISPLGKGCGATDETLGPLGDGCMVEDEGGEEYC